MATFYIGNKKVMGGGVGSVATASTASMANNAQLLNGVSQNRILEKWETTCASLHSPGWYRIGRTKGSNCYSGKGGILILERASVNASSEMYVFSISVGYDNNYDITQLSGTRGNETNGCGFSRIRLLRKNDAYWIIEVYYALPYINDVYITGIGGLMIDSSVSPSLIPDGYVATPEFATVVGFKAMHPN